MATGGSSKEGGVTKVILKHGNEECSGELDIDPDIVVDGEGQVLQDASFEFVKECVDTDTELSEEQRERLQFVPESSEVVATTESPSDEITDSPVNTLVKRLKVFAKEVESKVKKDPVIKRATKQILSECITRPETGANETDSGEPSHVIIDWGRLRSYIQEVFEVFFADLGNADHDVGAITILANLGAGLGYCYYLIKHIILTVMDSTTFKDVVIITCKVICFLFRHLVMIQFGTILQKIGGWNSLIATTTIDQGTRAVAEQVARFVPLEYVFFGVGVAAIAISAYLKFIKR